MYHVVLLAQNATFMVLITIDSELVLPLVELLETSLVCILVSFAVVLLKESSGLVAAIHIKLVIFIAIAIAIEYVHVHEEYNNYWYDHNIIF